MLDLPYQSHQRIHPHKKYVVMLTYLPLAKYRFLPQFIYFVCRIVVQLRKSKGLVGYTLRAALLKKQFWTLSIWENEQLMRDFVMQSPHLYAMADLQGKMGKTAFFQWHIAGEELPLSWEQALVKAKQKT